MGSPLKMAENGYEPETFGALKEVVAMPRLLVVAEEVVAPSAAAKVKSTRLLEIMPGEGLRSLSVTVAIKVLLTVVSTLARAAPASRLITVMVAELQLEKKAVSPTKFTFSSKVPVEVGMKGCTAVPPMPVDGVPFSTPL